MMDNLIHSKVRIKKVFSSKTNNLEAIQNPKEIDLVNTQQSTSNTQTESQIGVQNNFSLAKANNHKKQTTSQAETMSLTTVNKDHQQMNRFKFSSSGTGEETCFHQKDDLSMIESFNQNEFSNEEEKDKNINKHKRNKAKLNFFNQSENNKQPQKQIKMNLQHEVDCGIQSDLFCTSTPFNKKRIICDIGELQELNEISFNSSMRNRSEENKKNKQNKLSLDAYLKINKDKVFIKNDKIQIISPEKIKFVKKPNIQQLQTLTQEIQSVNKQKIRNISTPKNKHRLIIQSDQKAQVFFPKQFGSNLENQTTFKKQFSNNDAIQSNIKLIPMLNTQKHQSNRYSNIFKDKSNNSNNSLEDNKQQLNYLSPFHMKHNSKILNLKETDLDDLEQKLLQNSRRLQEQQSRNNNHIVQSNTTSYLNRNFSPQRKEIVPLKHIDQQSISNQELQKKRSAYYKHINTHDQDQQINREA